MTKHTNWQSKGLRNFSGKLPCLRRSGIFRSFAAAMDFRDALAGFVFPFPEHDRE